MAVLPLLFLMGVLHLTLAGVLGKHVDHRNLFTQRACCKRQSHIVYIGQDISGSPVSVDVGMCRSHCGAAPRTSQEGAQQQEYSKHSSMLEFLRNKKARVREPATPGSAETLGLPSCRVNQVCEPTGRRVERVLLFEGPREVEVIEECQCAMKMTQCLRVPALKTYFFETPYEAVIDVGACSNSKGSPEGFSCVPTQFESSLVETPNKVDVIQTVVSCELKESCYRVPYIQYYYEVLDHGGGVREERLKEIDVGRCLGGCSTGNQCLLRNPSDPEVCLLWAERPSSSCVPKDHESHTFYDQHGQIRTVHSITSCTCQG